MSYRECDVGGRIEAVVEHKLFDALYKNINGDCNSLIVEFKCLIKKTWVGVRFGDIEIFETVGDPNWEDYESTQTKIILRTGKTYLVDQTSDSFLDQVYYQRNYFRMTILNKEELEKQRLEKERLEKERLEKERLERLERDRRRKEEDAAREKERLERLERLKQEQKPF